MISDSDQDDVVQKLTRDLRATIGAGHDHLAVDNAIRVRQFIPDVDDYVAKVVGDTQQDMHDQFIDTDWPKCPRHSHPLWFHLGAWWCEQDGVRVAALGEL